MSFGNVMDDFTYECTLIERRRVPDGEGGWVTTWFDGPEFTAAIVMDNSLEARVADKEGMRAIYTVTTERGTVLSLHDVFRRNSDGQVFRVTSNGDDKQTPRRASFQISQVSAEEWELTSDS